MLDSGQPPTYKVLLTVRGNTFPWTRSVFSLHREGNHRKPFAEHKERNNLLKASNKTTSLGIPSPSIDRLDSHLITAKIRRKFGVVKGSGADKMHSYDKPPVKGNRPLAL